MSLAVPRTLFLARGRGAVAWYRCVLPAKVLGCDWLGLAGAPKPGAALCGAVAGPGLDDVGAYEVVVVQQARGQAWLEAIAAWQQQGVAVLYEVDDWLHGVAQLPDHGLAAHYGPADLREYEACMRAADGLICSTPWLAERYAEHNPRVAVCRNGVDLRRFSLERPAREHVTIGWAGGTGHRTAIEPWLGAVAAVMREHPHTRLRTVGDPHAARLTGEFGPERCRTVPFSAMEVYPAAMAHFDVALAPAGSGGYFRAKSDLRWLEAGAMGLATVADPALYAEVQDGVTGLHAHTPAEAEHALRALVADRELRERLGAAARAHVERHRSAQVAARAWASVLHQARAAAPLAA